MAADTPVRSAEALGPAPSTPSGIQQAKLFRIYNHYRLVVSLMLVALLFVDPVNFDMRFRLLDYYQAGVSAYLGLNASSPCFLWPAFTPASAI